MSCDNYLFPHVQLRNEFILKNMSPGKEEMPYKIDLQIKINFPSEKMKSVSQHKAVTVFKLVAEAGGYVGIFMGCSLLQLPGFCMLCGSALKKSMGYFGYCTGLSKQDQI
jgi:hypothetical protein